MKRNHCVYILASGRNGTLYTGVTNDLVRRMWEHREGRIEGFTKKYNVHRLVYYEVYEDPLTAIRREKEIKRWRRDWKIQAIMNRNPAWLDLSERLINDLPWH
ncbi:MAG: GIY-YIG nuclease family protein [Micropepsaceae bacterium]